MFKEDEVYSPLPSLRKCVIKSKYYRSDFMPMIKYNDNGCLSTIFYQEKIVQKRFQPQSPMLHSRFKTCCNSSIATIISTNYCRDCIFEYTDIYVYVYVYIYVTF